MENKLSIVMSTDNNYFKIMAVTIISIFENNKDFESIIIYCLVYNVDDKYKDELKRIAGLYNRKIEFINIELYSNKYRFWEKEEDSRYIRLILPEILKEDKVLYLDCDIIVNNSLKKIWKCNLNGYAQAAVLDTARENARLEAKINKNEYYFNSGVLLINLKFWRENNIIDKFKKFKLQNSDKGIYRDQRVINGVLSKNTLMILPIYNFTPEMQKFNSNQIKILTKADYFYLDKDIEEARTKPVIIHFAGRSIDRPWFLNSEHKYTDVYREFMKKDNFTNFALWKDNKKNVIKWWIRKRLPYIIFYYFSRKKNM